MVTQDQIDNDGASDDDALTVHEAARFLACSASKLNKARVNGAGPIFIKDGRSVRYLRRDLRDYRNARKRRSTSDAPAAATVAA